MKRRLVICAIVGVCLTATLSVLSSQISRLFPYRDLPMIPKPFFIFALFPGFIVGELFAPGWAGGSAFFLTNALAYSTAVFAVGAIIRRITRAFSNE